MEFCIMIIKGTFHFYTNDQLIMGRYSAKIKHLYPAKKRALPSAYSSKKWSIFYIASSHQKQWRCHFPCHLPHSSPNRDTLISTFIQILLVWSSKIISSAHWIVVTSAKYSPYRYCIAIVSYNIANSAAQHRIGESLSFISYKARSQWWWSRLVISLHRNSEQSRSALCAILRAISRKPWSVVLWYKAHLSRTSPRSSNSHESLRLARI